MCRGGLCKRAVHKLSAGYLGLLQLVKLPCVHQDMHVIDERMEPFTPTLMELLAEL
jgi:hypothetical protein